MKNILVFMALAVPCVTSFSAGDWEFLEMGADQAIAVRGILKHEDTVFFNLLDGYMPHGKDLGYEKIAGGRIRFLLYSCGSKTAELNHIWVRDVEAKLFVDKEMRPTMTIPVNGDRGLERATRYVCGDKSAKIFEPINASPAPKDLIVLVCTTESKRDVVFEVSESSSTVNNGTAVFSKSEITFSRQLNDAVYVTKINRFTGQFRGEDKKNNFVLTGECKQQATKRF